MITLPWNISISYGMHGWKLGVWLRIIIIKKAEFVCTIFPFVLWLHAAISIRTSLTWEIRPRMGGNLHVSTRRRVFVYCPCFFSFCDYWKTADASPNLITLWGVRMRLWKKINKRYIFEVTRRALRIINENSKGFLWGRVSKLRRSWTNVNASRYARVSKRSSTLSVLE